MIVLGVIVLIATGYGLKVILSTGDRVGYDYYADEEVYNEQNKVKVVFRSENK